MPKISFNPYEGVNWNSYGQYKTEFHAHTVKWPDRGDQELIDLYVNGGEDNNGEILNSEDEYDALAIDSGKNKEGLSFPWIDRDPQSLGVISFPCLEHGIGPSANPDAVSHVNTPFSELTHDDWFDGLGSDVSKLLDLVADNIKPKPESLAVHAHPGWWLENDHVEGLSYYDSYLQNYTHDDGLIGIEVYCRAGPGWDDSDLWDELLTDYMPDRPILGFGVDDASSYVIGEDIDLGITYTLIEESNFNPSDQAGTRAAMAEAFTEGRLFIALRDEWHHPTESPPTVPTINSINIDGLNISIDASDYDEIVWISSGIEVDTGESTKISGTHQPYLRAEVRNHGYGDDQYSQPWQNQPGATLATQPWGIVGDDTIIGDADLGEVHIASGSAELIS